jgi:hypothetical protein
MAFSVQSTVPLSDPPASAPPVPLVALAGWAVPGLGYFLIGESRRGLISGVAILALFVMGILIAGVRCIDVPGFDGNGDLKRTAQSSQPLIQSHPFRAVIEKPWYIPQIMAGPVTIAGSLWSVGISDTYPKGTARLWDIGTLYTAVAGMLNLLVLIDAAHRAAKIRDANPTVGPM